MKGTVKRDFKVLTEKISPENIAVMAELIAMRETKVLIGFMGYHAEKAHKKLCKDIDRGFLEPYGKHESCARLPYVGLELSRNSKTAFESGKRGI